MSVSEFKLFPPDRMGVEFPWQFWSIGWLALFKAFLWLAYEPVQDESMLYILGIRFLVNIVPLTIFAIGVWNMRRWAVWGLVVLSLANLLFFHRQSADVKGCCRTL